MFIDKLKILLLALLFTASHPIGTYACDDQVQREDKKRPRLKITEISSTTFSSPENSDDETSEKPLRKNPKLQKDETPSRSASIDGILSTQHLVSSPLLHATMFEEHRDSPIPSGFQAGVPAVAEDDFIGQLFLKRLQPSIGSVDISILLFLNFKKLITEDKLTADNEDFLRKILKDEDFITISNHGWEAGHSGNYDLQFVCLRLAAIKDLMADQEKLAYHYLDKKDYKSAAKWYLRSALNGNSDILSELYRINDETHILQHLTSEGLPQAMTMLEAYWKSQEAAD